MQMLEYHTINKEGWGLGPWLSEPDKRQWLDPSTGLPCLIVRGPVGALCGYVGVPPIHSAYRKSYDDIEVDVHGGLTFAGSCRKGCEQGSICHKVEPGESDDAWWFGFDCSHLGDWAPGILQNCSSEYLKHFGLGAPTLQGRTVEYRNIAYVETEVKNLAAQLSKM